MGKDLEALLVGGDISIEEEAQLKAFSRRSSETFIHGRCCNTIFCVPLWPCHSVTCHNENTTGKG